MFLLPLAEIRWESSSRIDLPSTIIEEPVDILRKLFLQWSLMSISSSSWQAMFWWNGYTCRLPHTISNVQILPGVLYFCLLAVDGGELSSLPKDIRTKRIHASQVLTERGNVFLSFFYKFNRIWSKLQASLDLIYQNSRFLFYFPSIVRIESGYEKVDSIDWTEWRCSSWDVVWKPNFLQKSVIFV